MEQHTFLWAKTNDQGDWHPLLFHMIDSGAVALQLWKSYLPQSSRLHFATSLNLPEDDAARLVAFWVSLHDIGKASPAFQYKSPSRKQALLDMGFPGQDIPSPAPHGHVTAWALQSLLPPQIRFLSRILAAHHGTLVSASALLDPTRSDQLGRDPVWAEMRESLCGSLNHQFHPPETPSLPEDSQEKNILSLLILGLTVASDWVSSDSSHFTFSAPDTPVADYFARSTRIACETVKKLGFAGWQPQGDEIPFSQQFAYRGITSPNPIQAAVIDACSKASLPAMVILEAPTGIGKTEAALYLADTWLQKTNGRGIYIAMPTTATSNQMFERTYNYLQHRYADELVNIQLVHGQALLDDAYTALQLVQIDDDESGRIAAMSWFTAKKRSLLAPFGVGTVDQVFLSVLQSRFFFLRLFGLEGKVVIFDEVHAYDTYMSTLMYRLLGWLKAIGASVIILSATLPDVTRRKLVESYSGSVLQEDSSEIPPYPRMTVSSTSDHTVVPLPANPDQARTIKLQWIDSDPQTQIQFLDEHLAEGGCAAVICNTVARAQEVYAAIKSSAIVSDGDCFLFHARFPYAWRKKTEETILERFSLQGTRPHKAIVVATQVIEQSLDLDFDLMISDLAPIDLLIQRAGRLHRHNRKRPSTLTSPLLALTQPGNTAKHDPDFGLSQYIYAPYILDRTWLTLRHLQSLSLPENTSSLIESVYGSEGIQGLSQDELGRLDSEKRKMLTEETQDISDARSRVILPSDDEGFFTGGTIGLEEDNPELHSSLQALTRADSPGITAICLHQLPDGTLVTDPQDRSTATSLEAEVTLDNLKKLLRSSIQINRIDLVNWLSRKGIPDTWKKSASLRHCRLLVFSNGACPIDGTPLVLYLTRELGLSFIKEVK